MPAARQRFIETNGIRLHVREQGEGPLVILCHGFPETSHAWRHQLDALGQAGFHAVAPDLRGYGDSDCPPDIAHYSVLDVIGDLVGLADALGQRQAVLVGNDWGASIAWQAAQLRPDRFRAVAALGVPMMGRAPMAPSRLFPQNEQAWFYTHYFCEPGLAEQEFERDIALTLRKIYYGASGALGPREAATPNPFGMVPRAGGLLDALPDPAVLPAWLAAADLAQFARAFGVSGFRGGLNYYRNLDRNWRDQAAFAGLRVEVPALYLAGEYDTGLAMPGMRQIIEAMPAIVPDLRGSQVIAGAGHWLPQEAPDAVNAALIGFLRAL
ncbi:alpha/beta fold hydrolase [Achromobacter insuavis]|uniref:alpha/beta fold hydrolase n=1 Tax=Achromobacter insuavis TaxID=1287735 RepID=UPI0029D6A1D8|nr:alpha/beta hydrolase [Achromobacter sp.]